MFRNSTAKQSDNYGRVYSIDKVEYTIEKWEFNIDGMYGHIYFTVDKGIYKYDANNGAYCSSIDETRDLINVATPCFLDEDEVIRLPLYQIFKQAIEFADFNLTRL